MRFLGPRRGVSACIIPPLPPCSAALARGGRRERRAPNRPSAGRGYAMNALSPLGMVSEIPSENQSFEGTGIEVQKDYFVEKNGVKFAGTHLLVDLWGASNLA